MINARKLPYSRSTCFLVPLRTSGYAIGVVARLDGQGAVIGHFFGPVLLDKDQVTLPTDLHPAGSVLTGTFGDLGLVRGEWPILGQTPNWVDALWAIPPLARRDALGEQIYLTTYDDETLQVIEEREGTEQDLQRYPYDRLMGYGAVEIRLTHVLQAGQDEY